MKCKHFQNLIKTDYLDKELKGDLYLKVEEHLKTCPVCQKLKEELLKEKELFRNFQDNVVPESVWDNIYNEITQGPLKKTYWLDLLRGFIIKRKRLVFATLFTGIFILGGIVLKNVISEEKTIQFLFRNYFLNGETKEFFYDFGTSFEEFFL
ncbi:MAG: zf-HC2 domain-containing protein [Candidatus Omnitrophica bacterium]|nr:zf-HC2 domain-containing protein [Candidatus Omnitrophota bacterium]